MVCINGDKYNYAGLSVTEILEKLGFSKDRIATELNGKIVAKTNYDTTLLQDEDTVEVVSFVGGG